MAPPLPVDVIVGRSATISSTLSSGSFSTVAGLMLGLVSCVEFLIAFSLSNLPRSLRPLPELVSPSAAFGEIFCLRKSACGVASLGTKAY